MNPSTMDTTTVEKPLFEVVFAPIAHHLYPDGPPPSFTPEQTDCWPTTRDSREVVSGKKAKAAIDDLYNYARRHGLSIQEQWSVAIAACTTLGTILHDESSMSCTPKNSPLMDGTCQTFASLVKCLIPNIHLEINSQVCFKLLSIANQCNSRGKAVIARWMTLVVRHANLKSTSTKTSARWELSCCYNVIFHLLLSWDPTIVPDVVRLLYALTRSRHVTVARAKRLYDLYQSIPPQQQPQYAHCKACILLLLQLYAKYDPIGCGSYFPTKANKKLHASAYSKCFKIPNEKWERDFIGEFFRVHDEVNDNNDELDQLDDWNDTTMMERPHKRPRFDANDSNQNVFDSISSTLDWLEHAFEGVHSFSTTTPQRHIVRASKLLMDPTMRHLLSLSSFSSNNHAVEVKRLRTCLPFMLYEEWHYSDNVSIKQVANVDASLKHDNNDSDSISSSDDDNEQGLLVVPNEPSNQDAVSPRNQVLKALSCMATGSTPLLPELQTFVLEELLPRWDGTLGVLGKSLLFDLLPTLVFSSFSELESKLLIYLSPLLLYGPPRLLHAILSGTLTNLLRNWSTTVQDDAKHSVWQRQLIQWTERHVLTGVVLTGTKHELPCLGVIDFYHAVVDLAHNHNILVTPSPFVIYKLLLSPSALCVDRVCRLLVSYRDAFVKLKAISTENSDVVVEGLDRIVLLNSFIWDFCSVLYKASPLSTLVDAETNPRSILFADMAPRVRQVLLQMSQTTNQDFVDLAITHGTGYCGFASRFLQEQQQVTPRGLSRGKTKAKYLEFLGQTVGMHGLYDFLTTFVASLAKYKTKTLSNNKN